MISLGVVFLIHQRPEITEANYLNDGFWSDAPEVLPDGSVILVRDIKKALEGEEFFYFPSGEKRLRALPPVEEEAFSHYHRVYRYYRKFGLPHGRGWLNELPWVPEFLAYFDDLRIEIEAWLARNGGKEKIQGDVDPRLLTG